MLAMLCYAMLCYAMLWYANPSFSYANPSFSKANLIFSKANPSFSAANPSFFEAKPRLLKPKPSLGVLPGASPLLDPFFRENVRKTKNFTRIGSRLAFRTGSAGSAGSSR